MTEFIAKEGDVASAFLTSWSSWGTIGAVVVTMDPRACSLALILYLGVYFIDPPPWVFKILLRSEAQT